MNDRIVIDPKICHGKPAIRGTRTPVAIVVGSLAGGMSFEDVQREYDDYRGHPRGAGIRRRTGRAGATSPAACLNRAHALPAGRQPPAIRRADVTTVGP